MECRHDEVQEAGKNAFDTALSTRDDQPGVRGAKPMTLFFRHMASPVGMLKLVASGDGLVAISWENDDPGRVRLGAMVEQADQEILAEAAGQLEDYFDGRRTVFELKLDLRGTEFQKQVWKALLAIPFGETRTYGGIANELGRPNASRAVGAANGRNPISIVAACHRVVGSNGSLTGFAGGLAAKKYLLGHETAAPVS
jgi:methylated-DNA-[protein]-cysteine S-methyltransferase